VCQDKKVLRDKAVCQDKRFLRDKELCQDKEVIRKAVVCRDKATKDQNVTIQILDKKNRRRNHKL
jgi:hypothetical protein